MNIQVFWESTETTSSSINIDFIAIRISDDMKKEKYTIRLVYGSDERYVLFRHIGKDRVHVDLRKEEFSILLELLKEQCKEEFASYEKQVIKYQLSEKKK